MERARTKGYKVYLYFIATNSPEINKDRVRTRVLQGGHDVPTDRIEKRYHLAMGNLRPALAHCYHAFLFDNSGTEPVMFAEMKETTNGPSWAWNIPVIPDWFIRNYIVSSGDAGLLEIARQAIRARG